MIIIEKEKNPKIFEHIEKLYLQYIVNTVNRKVIKYNIPYTFAGVIFNYGFCVPFGDRFEIYEKFEKVN